MAMKIFLYKILHISSVMIIYRIIVQILIYIYIHSLEYLGIISNISGCLTLKTIFYVSHLLNFKMYIVISKYAVKHSKIFQETRDYTEFNLHNNLYQKPKDTLIIIGKCCILLLPLEASN
jgi:hypothetical protein